MSMARLSACGIIGLCLFTLGPNPAQADVSLTTTGISSLAESTASEAEKTAIDDALFKAYLETALKLVSGSSSLELTRRLKPFVASRGSQDVIQYKISSRSQLNRVLILSMDFVINDGPLREWLRVQSFMTPLALRPKILIAVTTRGPGQAERHEWWTSSMPKGYSSFEKQFAARLRESGEYVMDPPARITVPPEGPDRALVLAGSEQADLILTGLLTHRVPEATVTDSRLDLSLTDARTRQRVTSFSLTLRGTVDQVTMNDLLISAAFDQIRAEVAKKVVAVNLSVQEKILCIEGIRGTDAYQAIMNALRSMSSVSKVTVTQVQGHTVCHTLQIQGSLQDVMESLRQKGIVSADMAVDGDTAHIRILNQ